MAGFLSPGAMPSRAPFQGLTPAQLAQLAAASFRPPSLPSAAGMSMPQQQQAGGMGMGEAMGMLGMGMGALKKPAATPGQITPGSINPANPVQPGQMVSTSAIDRALETQPLNAGAMPTAGGGFFDWLGRNIGGLF